MQRKSLLNCNPKYPCQSEHSLYQFVSMKFTSYVNFLWFCWKQKQLGEYVYWLWLHQRTTEVLLSNSNVLFVPWCVCMKGNTFGAHAHDISKFNGIRKWYENLPHSAIGEMMRNTKDIRFELWFDGFWYIDIALIQCFYTSTKNVESLESYRIRRQNHNQLQIQFNMKSNELVLVSRSVYNVMIQAELDAKDNL